MSTKMLELTISKVSTLLQRGFGEKGAQIVSRALTYDERFVEWLIPGRKVNMIFSFCQIKQFSDITDCLHDEIIVFVNKIVQIIHECAKKWDGYPTKNQGDKYLLTWRIPTIEDVKKIQQHDSARSGNANPEDQPVLSTVNDIRTPRQYAPWMKEEQDDFDDLKEGDVARLRTEIADKALISAVKTVAELGRAVDLQAYSRHPKIAPKFLP